MQNYLFALLLIASLLAGFAYPVLEMQAHAHLNKKSTKSDRTIGRLFWWSFDQSVYSEAGKKIGREGQVLAVLIIALVVGLNWFLLRR